MDWHPEQWFSKPQETIEEAQALHQPKPLSFEPAAVYQTPEGKFVMGLLKPNCNWPPHKEAKDIQELVNYRMVSHCDPLLGIWKTYEENVGT